MEAPLMRTVRTSIVTLTIAAASRFAAPAISSGKIGAMVLCVSITRARALLNRLAPAHSPAPFGEADAAERQLEFAQLL